MTNHKDDNLQEIKGERGMPSVNAHGPTSAQRGLIVAFILLVMCLAGSAMYWKHQKNKAQKADLTSQAEMHSSSVPAHTFESPPKALATPASVAPPLPGSMASSTQPSFSMLDKSESPLMVLNQRSTESNRFSQRTETESQGPMAALLTSTSTPPRSASKLGNRNFILAKGSFINCALQTKLDSTVPGMTECRVTRNIYGDNGKVLLIERGSTVSGEYQSNLRQGMARIFVLWSRIKTPHGIVIPLDSPGTDQLGASGVPGYVDNHFWQRFGGALMLSLIDDVAKGLVASQTHGDGRSNFTFNNSSEATQNMAAEALRNTINIPPTLYKNQGSEVGIYVARDLDFSSVYDVATQ